MSSREYILPYYLIVQALKHREGASREELILLLKEAGFELSLRSFQRMLESLRTEMGVPVNYDTAANNYKIDHVPEKHLGNFFRFCHLLLEAGFLQQQLPYLEGESHPVFLPEFEKNGGAEWLNTIGNAIAEKLLIRVRINSAKSDEDKNYTLLPVALKKEDEYWILLAWQVKKEKWRQLKTSRILELEIKESGLELSPPDLKNVLIQFIESDKLGKKSKL